MSYIARRSFLLGVAGVLAAALVPSKAAACAQTPELAQPTDVRVQHHDVWYIDPANVTRNASDTNDGRERNQPLRTFGALQDRLSVIDRPTTIMFLSDSCEPLYYCPRVVDGGYLRVCGGWHRSLLTAELPRGSSSVRALARRQNVHPRSRSIRPTRFQSLRRSR
jgi:hypothetical protein